MNSRDCFGSPLFKNLPAKEKSDMISLASKVAKEKLEIVKFQNLVGNFRKFFAQIFRVKMYSNYFQNRLPLF